MAFKLVADARRRNRVGKENDLCADKELVLGAVSVNGLALERASEGLKADRDVVLAAVRQNGHALQFASEDLQRDRDIMIAAVRFLCNLSAFLYFPFYI